MYATTDRLWGIILAGGEGRRLQHFIRLHWGSKRPKQYYSRAILARSTPCLGVLRVKGVYWSDWGNPEQVRMDVARFAPGSDHEPRLSGNAPLSTAG